MSELLKFPVLCDFQFSFPYRDGCGQGLADGLGLHLIGQPQVGAMAGIIGSRAVAGRLPAATDDAGDGTRTKVAQFGEGAQQVASFLLKLGKYTFRTELQKKTRR